MSSEFNNALTLLLKKEIQPSTRFIYKLWDIVKDPTKILEKIGDKLAGKGWEECVIGRVKGLHDFWVDLGKSPPSDTARAHFRRLFTKQADERTWAVGERLAEALNADLLANPAKESPA